MNNDSIYDSIQRAIRAIQGDYQKSITDVISTINKDMSKLFDTDFFRQINRRVDEYEINIKTGWWYPGSIIDDLPANETEAALGSEEYNKAFTKLVVRQSRKNGSQKLHEMRERWAEYGFIPKSRRRILVDLLDAHIERKYSLSIPVAMAQIDHYAKSLFPASKEQAIDNMKSKNLDTIISEQQVNFARHFGLDDYNNVPADDYFDIYPIYYSFKNILFANDSLRGIQKRENLQLFKLSNQASRHRILHGENSSYVSEQLSLKQVLFLDKIFQIINRIMSER